MSGRRSSLVVRTGVQPALSLLPIVTTLALYLPGGVLMPARWLTVVLVAGAVAAVVLASSRQRVLALVWGWLTAALLSAVAGLWCLTNRRGLLLAASVALLTVVTAVRQPLTAAHLFTLAALVGWCCRMTRPSPTPSTSA